MLCTALGLRYYQVKMKTITVLLSICWVLWFSQIFAISTLLHSDFPEIAVAQTLVSLIDRPIEHIHLNPDAAASPSDGTADKIANLTASAGQTPTRLDHDPANIVADRTTADPDAAGVPIDLPLGGASTPAQVDPINDTGGGDLPADVTTPVPPANTSETSTHAEPSTTTVVEETQIPLFSEWAQKRMEEVEKEQEQDAANTSTQKRNHTAGQKVGTASLKLRTKNYASPDCGAKIVASNAESSNTRAVLTLTKDEYLLSPCTSRIWFVVELCEAIQAEMIDLANFELFSSSPRNFSVAVANRFPTRDWSQVGRFTAHDERYIQSFDLHPHLFGKYVRVDIHSHYNSEHFCPISLFRVFGTSEFEAFETENRIIGDGDDDDDDDDDDAAVLDRKEDRNIFKTASDAMMSIVKAAATFVKPQENRTEGSDRSMMLAGQTGRSGASLVGGGSSASESSCISPVHLVQCVHCSDNFTAAVADVVACKQQLLRRWLTVGWLYGAIVRSQICAGLVGVNVSENGGGSVDCGCPAAAQPTSDWIMRLLPVRYVAAMCNILASDEMSATAGAVNSSRRAQGTIVTASNVTIDRKDNSIRGPDNREPSVPVVVDHRPAVIFVKPMVGVPGSEQSLNNVAPELEAAVPQPAHPSDDQSNGGHPTTTDDATLLTQIPSPLIVDSDLPMTTTSSGINSADKKNEAYVFEGERDVEPAAVTPPVAEPLRPDPTRPLAAADLADLPVNSILEMASELLNAAAEPVASIVPTTTTLPPTLLADGEAVAEADALAVATNGATMPGGQKVQSESVFLRLSNRVKSLERNMSLSGQYLEELSRRYKKQVEELQLAFAKTLLIVEEQNKRTAEREEQLFAQNERLRDDLTELNERLAAWPQHVAYVATMLCVQCVWWLLRRLCGARTAADAAEAAVEISGHLATDRQMRSARLRRKSTDGATRLRSVFGGSGAVAVTGSEAPGQHVAAKRRRPSEEALHIAGSYAELMIEEDEEELAEVSADAEEYDHFADPTNGLTARQQRKHRRHVRRTMSLDQTTVHGHQLIRQRLHQQQMQQQQQQQSGRGSYDNLAHSAGTSDTESAGSEPVLDENYESYVPGSDMVYNEFMPDGPSGQSTPLLAPVAVAASGAADQANGGVTKSTSSGGSLGSKKSEKFRRLSSPAFLKSPFSRSSSLSLGGKSKASGHEQTTGWEWYRRKESASAAAAAAAAAAASTNSSQSTVAKKSASGKKSKSESPPGPATVTANGEPAGARSSSATTLSESIGSASKKPGSFRRMLKKVF